MDRLRDALVNSEAGQEHPASPRKGSGPRGKVPTNFSPASKGTACSVPAQLKHSCIAPVSKMYAATVCALCPDT